MGHQRSGGHVERVKEVKGDGERVAVSHEKVAEELRRSCERVARELQRGSKNHERQSREYWGTGE